MEEKGGLDVGCLPEDVLLLSVLINLCDERQQRRELLTAALFSHRALTA